MVLLRRHRPWTSFATTFCCATHDKILNPENPQQTKVPAVELQVVLRGYGRASSELQESRQDSRLRCPLLAPTWDICPCTINHEHDLHPREVKLSCSLQAVPCTATHPGVRLTTHVVTAAVLTHTCPAPQPGTAWGCAGLHVCVLYACAHRARSRICRAWTPQTTDSPPGYGSCRPPTTRTAPPSKETSDERPCRR